MTPGGRRLVAADLYGRSGTAPFSRQRADMVWDKASRSFAEGVTGDVTAFTAGTSPNPLKTFYGTELPALRQNPAWGRRVTYRGY